MIDEKMSKREIDRGLTAICAWCEHLHNARRGKVWTCGRSDCGGPLVGRAFPDYKGPMEGRLSSFCFLCGESADAAVEINGGMLGVCNRKGPEGETCLDKFMRLLRREDNVIVKEQFVPVVGGGKTELSSVGGGVDGGKQT